MADRCSNNKDNVNSVVENDRYRTRIYKTVFSKYFPGWEKRSREFSDFLLEQGYDAHTFIPEKDLKLAWIKKYGRKKDREFLAMELIALLEANPNIIDMVHRYILVRLPNYVYLGKEKFGFEKESRVVDVDLLSRLPIKQLTGFVNKVQDLVKQQDMFGFTRAKIGDFSTQFKSPKKLGWLDPTGAWDAINIGTRDYATRIATRIENFMKYPKNLKGLISDETYKKVKYGYEKLQEKVRGISLTSNKEEKATMFRMFSAYMKGWIFIDTNKTIIDKNKTSPTYGQEIPNPDYNKFMINTDYSPRMEPDPDNPGKFRPMRYKHRVTGEEGMGDVMYSFQNPVRLDEWSQTKEGKSKKANLYVELNDSQLKTFLELAGHGRALTDAVFEYIVPEMEKSTVQIIDKFIDLFDGKFGNHLMDDALRRTYNEWAIKNIFFFGNTEIDNPTEGQIGDYTLQYKEVEDEDTGIMKKVAYIDLLEKLSEEDLEIVNIIQDSFTNTVSDGLVLANGGAVYEDEPEFRKNYWPTIYNDDVLDKMVGIYITEMQGEIDKAKKFLADNIGKLNDATIKLVEKAIEDLTSKRDAAVNVQNNMGDYHLDTQTSTLMHLAADNKHFKRISNAYDIRSSRMDEGVFSDYLTANMTAVERNYLAGGILDMLLRIKEDKNSKKPKLSKDETLAIINSGINVHGTTYHSLDVVGMFGSVNSFTSKANFFRKWGPVHRVMQLLERIWPKRFTGTEWKVDVSPEIQSRYLRNFTSRISGLFLQSVKSVFTNFTGVTQNIHRSSAKLTWEALSMYYWDTVKQKGITKLINLSGITNFSDFFSASMVSGIVQSQLEAQVSEQIMKEMVLYHVNKKKIGAAKANKIFLENTQKWLGESQLWATTEQLYIRNLDELRYSIPELKSRMKLHAANKLVQWAIEKRYELKPMVAQGQIRRWASTGFGKAVGLIGKILNNPTLPITMSNTEKGVRSISFILGVEKMWRQGLIRNDIHWSQYTDPQDIAMAIAIGTEYSYEANFQMSTQGVASYQYGPASFFGKFKYWSQQKFETDQSMFTDAMLTDKSIKNTKGMTFNIVPFLKLIGKIMSPGNKGRRMYNPEMAAASSLFKWSAPMMVMWDLLFLNPLTFTGRLKRFTTTMSGFFWKSKSQAHLKSMFHSDILSLFSIAIAMSIRSSWEGGLEPPDDEEEWEKTVNGLLQNNPYWGKGFSTSWDFFIAMLSGLVIDNEELFAKKMESVTSSIGPLKYGRPELLPIAEELLIRLAGLTVDERTAKKLFTSDFKTFLRNSGRHFWESIYSLR